METFDTSPTTQISANAGSPSINSRMWRVRADTLYGDGTSGCKKVSWLTGGGYSQKRGIARDVPGAARKNMDNNGSVLPSLCDTDPGCLRSERPWEVRCCGDVPFGSLRPLSSLPFLGWSGGGIQTLRRYRILVRKPACNLAGPVGVEGDCIRSISETGG